MLVARLPFVHSAGPSILAVGDWGGHDDSDPTTKAQLETASGMAKVAKELDAASVLLIGDNFYTTGVHQVNSSRFQDTFEDVYSKGDLQHLPFWIVAGNHDHRGNVSAQIAYSDASGRWRFPAEYYNLTYKWKTSGGQERTADLIMIDTVVLAGLTSDTCLDVGCPLEGPCNHAKAQTAWNWLQATLEGSTADFLWVAGHYPIYSAGGDGTTDVLVQKLLPLLHKHGAHYISGHDHMLEHIVSSGVNMFVTGMGMECCYNDDNIKTVPNGSIQYMLSGKNGQGVGFGPRPPSLVSGGFASLTFSDDDVEVAFYDQSGTKIYAAPPLAARRQSPVNTSAGVVV